MTGEEWTQRALERAEAAVATLTYALNVAGPTRSDLAHAYHELEAASQHLLDAGFELGIGDLRA